MSTARRPTRRQARGGAIRRTIVLPMCSRDNIRRTRARRSQRRPRARPSGRPGSSWAAPGALDRQHPEDRQSRPGRPRAARRDVRRRGDRHVHLRGNHPNRHGDLGHRDLCGTARAGASHSRAGSSARPGQAARGPSIADWLEKHTLAIRSYAPSKRGETIVVTSVPHFEKLVPERIVICGNPKNWEVNEIMSGQHSQLAQRDYRVPAARSDSAPGEMFTAGLELKMDALESWERFSMHVTYVGDQPNGRSSRASCSARSPRIRRSSPTSSSPTSAHTWSPKASSRPRKTDRRPRRRPPSPHAGATDDQAAVSPEPPRDRRRGALRPAADRARGPHGDQRVAHAAGRCARSRRGFRARSSRRCTRARALQGGGSGHEDWLDAPAVLRQRHADCEDLAAYRAAELRVAGVDCEPVIKWQWIPRRS